MNHPRAFAAAFVLVFAASGVTHAQDLPQSVTRRAVRAAVKLTVEVPGRGGRPLSSTGSGSIIDPRGYVLTNFHVVGHVAPGGGVPGTLFHPQNEVRISLAQSPRETAQERYIGRVVRADIRLDLALIRIVSDLRGAPLPASTRFATVPIADTSGLRPGSRLFAFGFPLGVQTINVTSGEMSGFQMNTRDQVAWIRTDAEFNPGNSGGMLLDRRGRLVAIPTAVLSGRGTLEPIELARPAERVPAEWRRELRRRHNEDTVIGGIPGPPLRALLHEAVGDGSSLDGPEMHFFRLPATRPLRVDVSPALTVGLLTENGLVVREGQGELIVRSTDPAGVVLGMLIPPRRDSGGGTLAIRVRTRAAQEGPAGWDDMPALAPAPRRP